MTSRRSNWCSLCGVLISPSLGSADGTDESELSWLSDVRVVRTLGATDTPWHVIVSGVGYLNLRSQVCASADPATHWRTSEGIGDGIRRAGLPSHLLFNSSKSYWCFPFHDVCWELLRDKVGRDVRPADLAVHLFSVFYNTPIHAHERLVPGHDYGGAAALRNVVRRQGYYYQVQASHHPFLVGDPREALQRDEHCLWEAVQTFATPFNQSGPLFLDSSSPESPNAFTNLPYEVIVIILTYLPSADLCNTRLAIRSVAEIASPKRLPQAFWRSRFLPEFEMGFVFAASSDQTPPSITDWRDLYVKAKATLSESELFPGFKNRQRIWRCQQHVANAVRARLKNQHRIRATPHTSMTPPILKGERKGSWISADASVAPGPSHSLAKSELISNCRLMELQRLPWVSDHNRRQTIIKAAFVHYCGKIYISGLGIQIRGPDGSTGEATSVGFIDTSNFEEQILMGEATLERVEVAICCTGVTGLRFHFGGESLETEYTFGDMCPSPQDGGIGELKPSEDKRISALIFGIDSFKFVAVSLVEQNLTQKDQEALPFADIIVNPDAPSEVWAPDLPKVPIEWRFKSTKPTQLLDMCLNMDFGGHDAGQLRKLTQVVARMSQYPAVFVGMKFVYEDGTERHFEHKSDLLNNGDMADPIYEQMFPIDGPGGEVIDRVTVSYSMEVETIRRIMIHTNHNRCVDFSLQVKKGFIDTLSVKTFEPEQGSLLTAFLAKIKMPGILPRHKSLHTPKGYESRGFFRNFTVGSVAINSAGLSEAQSTTSETVQDHMIPINRTTLASAEMMLRHQGGFIFAAADLSNIKRIRVSVGDNMSDPSSELITGLWLEYHDSKLPVIVGQWKMEIDSFDVDMGDRLVTVRIWHDWNSIYKRLPLGPVVGLLFKTASGVEKKFAYRYVVDRDCLSFRENTYESLTGILWGCNHKWDHVWALVKPNPKVPRLILGQHIAGHTQSSNASEVVYEKVFIPSESPYPNNPLVSIEATFWKLDKVPNSLKLTFQQGAPRILGHPQSEFRPQKFDLDIDAGEALTCMEIGVIGHGETSQIAYISFTTNKGRTLDFREEWWSAPSAAVTQSNNTVAHRVLYPFTPEAAVAAAAEASKAAAEGPADQVVDPNMQTLPPPSTSNSRYGGTPNTYRMGERYGLPSHGAQPPSPPLESPTLSTATTENNYERVKVVNIPPGAGRFVGLWALANHALEYPFLGPMFEEKQEEEQEKKKKKKKEKEEQQESVIRG